MINCDQIAVESARLKTMFAKCYNLKAIDLRSIVDLIESVSACSGGSFNLKTVNGQSLLGIGDIIVTAVVDGTETKVQQGTGITVSGNGSVANPYVITNSSTSVADGSETKINQGSNITIAGTGTTANPYVINAVIPAGADQVNADWAAISGISMILNKPNIPTKTSDLVNDGANGTNQFVVVGQEQQQSLQEVINVNKTADRVEFLFNTVNGGKLRGAFVYLAQFLIDPLNPTKTYLYGSFDTLDNASSANIVRINEDASMDTTFAVGSGFNDFPYAGSELIATPDGTLYVSGSFTNYNGINANRIISLNPDGSVNTAFAYGTGFNGFALGLAFNVAKTHLYVTGLFNDYNGTPTNRIIKLALDGTVDGTFVYGSGFDNTTVDVFVDTDDSLFVIGYFGSYNGNSSPRLAKILPNGNFDATFVVGTGFNTGNDQANFIFRNQAGVLICYGYFTVYNGTGAGHVIALNNDGTINGTYNFGTGFDGDIYGLYQLPNGKYVVEGGFTEFNGTASNGFIILNADFTVYSTYTELYYSPAIGTNAIYALIDIADYSQIVNIEAGVPITQRKLTFSEVNGKAEYLIGGLENVSSEEIMPRRLIEELINNSELESKWIKSNESLSLAQRKGDVLYGILDQYTGEEITLSKTNGIPAVDNIVYFQLGTEYFKRNKLENISVKNFGAKGDGLSDDTMAIQTTVNIASKLGFKVFIPSGEYMISSTIQFPFVSGSLSVEISGAKSESSYDKQGINPIPFSTVIRASQVMPAMFTARSGLTDVLSPYAKLNNLLLDGNGLAVNGYLNGGQDVIEDLTIFNCSGSGIVLETFTNSSIFNRVTCVANAGWGAELSGEWSTASVWNQCKFRGNTLGGMVIFKSIASRFTDCIYENNSGPGLKMYSLGNGGSSQVNNIMFSKCYFEQNNVTTGGGHQVIISGDGGTVCRNVIFDQTHILSGDVGKLGVQVIRGDKIRFISPLLTGNDITVPNWFNLGSEISAVSIEGLTDSDLDPTTVTIDGPGVDKLIIKGFSVLGEYGIYNNNVLTSSIRKNKVVVNSSRLLKYSELAGTVISNAGQSGGVYMDLPIVKNGYSFDLNLVTPGDFFFALRASAGTIMFENASVSEVAIYPVTVGGFLRVTSIDGYWMVSNLRTAPIDSPTLTGVPKAPTATVGTNNTQIANTAFVKLTVDSIAHWTKTGNDILNNNSGKVGIGGVFYSQGYAGFGTDSPAAKIHAKDTGDAVYARLQGVSNGDNYSVLELWDGVGNSKWQFAHKSIAGSNKDFEFAHFNGTSWSVPFVIKDNGTVKMSSLSGSGTRNVVADANGNLSTSTVSHKIWYGNLTQSSTTDPTSVELENSLGGAIVWARTSLGTYTGTLAGAFTLNKVGILFGSKTSPNHIVAVSSDVNTITIFTNNSSGALTDGVLQTTTFEIKVYN